MSDTDAAARKAAKKAAKRAKREAEHSQVAEEQSEPVHKIDKKRKQRDSDDSGEHEANNSAADLFQSDELLLKRETEDNENDLDLSSLRRNKDANAHLTGLTGVSAPKNATTSTTEPLTRIFVGNLPFKVQDDHM